MLSPPVSGYSGDEKIGQVFLSLNLMSRGFQMVLGVTVNSVASFVWLIATFNCLRKKDFKVA
jgi:hypothetical protein